MDLHCLFFLHCYKQEMVSFEFECQGIRQLKRKNYWKFGVLQIWKFWENTGPFPLGKVTKFFVGREEIIYAYKPTK